MNKYKKALNTIGDTLTYYMVRKDLALLPSDNEIFDSMETLRELVEKETPKKTIDIEFGPYGDMMLCCPNCHHGIVKIQTYNGNKYYPRCPFCGQKLEGENEDERYNYKIIKYCDTNTEFVFSINAREFAVSYCEEPKYTTVDEFKAIKQQLKKLRWI